MRARLVEFGIKLSYYLIVTPAAWVARRLGVTDFSGPSAAEDTYWRPRGG